MPDYSVVYMTEGGAEETRLIRAAAPNDAAAVVALAGHRVLRVDHAPSLNLPGVRRVNAEGPNLPRSRRNATGDFWAFRMMVTPDLIRIAFVVGTIAMACVLVAIPVASLAERQRVSKLAEPYAEELQQLQIARNQAAVAQAEIEAAQAEIGRVSNNANVPALAREAERAKMAAENRLRQIYASVGARDGPSLERLAAQTEASHRATLNEMPPIWRTIVMMLVTPIVWIGFRIVCEWFIIIFSIHERLVEMRQ